MSNTITVPTNLNFELPASLKGDKGDKGDPGKDGQGLFMRGRWTPVIGGEGGESGQVYSSQWGEYRIADGMCYLRGYVQFSSVGTITGQLALKGLPIPTALTPGFYGGDIAYFSNPRPSAGPLKLLASGGKNYALIYSVPQPGSNPLPCFEPTTLNFHSQIDIVFDYFTD